MRGRGIGGPKPVHLKAPAPSPAKAERLESVRDRDASGDFEVRDRGVRWNQLPPAAARELSAHVEELGLTPRSGHSDPTSAIAAAELASAQRHDARVTDKDMARAVQRARRALAVVPVPQKSLFGFTSLCDAKLLLDAKLVSALVDRALAKPGVTITDLRVLLKDERPITGGKPNSDLELAAMLVRQLVLHGGDSAQIALDPDRAKFLAEVLASEAAPIRKAMGGAGGFCANLCSALPNVASGYFSKEALHADIRGRFSPSVKLILPTGETGKAASTPPAGQAVSDMRTNYIAEYRQGAKLSLLGQDTFLIGGRMRPLEVKGSSRVILGAQSSFDPGFAAMDKAQIEALARSQDLMFLVGAHYYTKASPSEAVSKAKALAAQLAVMRAANPKLVSHFQYVVPKLEAHEAVVLRALHGAFHSMSLNSVELPGLLGRLRDAGLTHWTGDANASSADAEAPAAVLAGAVALKEAMGVSRLHVHALYGDVLIQDQVKEPERQVMAMLRARQLASMKNANGSGEIKAAEDIWPVVPVVKGDCLAGLYAFADALVEKFPALAADPRAHQRVIERWWHEDPTTGRTYFFVPSRGLHDRTGGSVSTGDTIDAAALVLGLEPTRRRKALPHPSAFR
jgi:ADP-dependent phosphofructokinase/glucokinase